MTWIRNPTICYIFVHILDLFVDGLDTLEEGRQVADALARLQMLCEQVRRIVFSANFDQLDGPIATSLLDPQALRIHMAQFA